MDAIKTFKVGNNTVKICYDEDPINPRDSNYQSNCDIFICFHKRYNLGDKHNYDSRDYNGWDELKEQIIKDLKPIEIRPLYMYDHSGITISSSSFSCPWDSSQIGFALITKKQALETRMVKTITKKTKEWAKKYLDASIKKYDNYLTGQLYKYVIEDEDDNEIESCRGSSGDIEEVIKEATEAAKTIVKMEV